MATLSITVGQITSTITVTDETAQELLSDYAAAYGLPQTGSPQTRLDAVTRHLAQHVQDAANAYNQRAGAEAERERRREALRGRRWREEAER